MDLHLPALAFDLANLADRLHASPDWVSCLVHHIDETSRADKAHLMAQLGLNAPCPGFAPGLSSVAVDPLAEFCD